MEANYVSKGSLVALVFPHALINYVHVFITSLTLKVLDGAEIFLYSYGILLFKFFFNIYK